MKCQKMKRSKIHFKFQAKYFGSCLIFSIIIAVFAFNCLSYVKQILAKEEEKKILNKQLKESRELYAQYEKNVNQLQVPEYLGRYAREKYSLSKDSEIIFKDNK